MKLMLAILSEVFRLFVDDGSLAIAILVWVGLLSIMQSLRVVDVAYMGPVALAGLAAILMENVARRARSR